jgi:superfamily II DNA helicase RecQ
VPIPPVRHTGLARLGSRVRPGWFAQTHVRPDLEDRTLLEIAIKQPRDMTALAGVSGVGQSKIDRYGAAVLEVLRLGVDIDR